ncbi:MAG: DnaD domain protein [Acetobacter sp.]|nr:DnaD domain protein [Bacteroides sp.]MCM1341027.1 DnaD domain protein [Acetobacter sp.]MCM1432417.1 DnaD domain protein [Clostridiales bacterium]
MDYSIAPFGDIWKNGIFNVPNQLLDKYLKLASEYQLKALLYILRNGGQSSSAEIAKALGQTAGDIDDLLEFWNEEGVLAVNGETVTPIPQPVIIDEIKEEKEKEMKISSREKLSPPRLSPKDIVICIRESSDIATLLEQAQHVLGRTISHAEQEMLINMVNYYGLPVEVILMILEFYRCEKKRGKSIGINYINSMAKNWSDEGIVTVTAAEEKLKEIEQSDRLWNEIVAITGIKHRRPTDNQRKMVTSWFTDFDIAMISLAADLMKENIPEPKLAYMDSIIKKWRKNGITNPAQVKAQQEEFEKQKQDKKDGERLQSKPSYDLEKFMKDSMNNTDII